LNINYVQKLATFILYVGFKILNFHAICLFDNYKILHFMKTILTFYEFYEILCVCYTFTGHVKIKSSKLKIKS